MICLVCVVSVWVYGQVKEDGAFRKTYPSETLEVGSQVTVTGEILWQEEADSYQTLCLQKAEIRQGNRSVTEPYFLVYEKSGKDFQIGNLVESKGQLEVFEEERNPGCFSRKRYYRFRKMAAYLWCEDSKCLKDTSDPLREALHVFRRKWKEKLLEVLGEEKGGILCAMLLGEKQQMDREIKTLYQMNGIAHVLAISGLHLSFVGMGFYRALRRMTGSYLAGGLAGITFLMCYILMIGSSVSAVRAVIMYCMRVSADMSGRVCDGPTSFMVAAAGVILWRPLAFYDAGFQLSFGAVAALYFLYPLVQDRVPTKGVGKILDSFKVSACVQIVTLPVILYHYYEFPLYGVCLNLLVIPLMSVVLFLGFVGSLTVACWYDGGKWILKGSGAILDLFETLCRIAEKLPGQRIITGRPSQGGIFGYYVLLIVMMGVLHWKKQRKEKLQHKQNFQESGRPKILKGMAGLIALLISTAFLVLGVSCPAYAAKQWNVTFLDVGQGDCAVLQTEEFVCMIDGGSSDLSGVGQYQIEPFLKYSGIRRIDYIFVSHGDHDHISGIEELLQRQKVGVQIGCLVFPSESVWDEHLCALYELACECQVQTAVIRKGQKISLGETEVICLGPEEDAEQEVGNEASMVLQVKEGAMSVLFTGDVEGTGEERLVEDLSSCSFLKVAHHGSAGGTSEAFLERVQPDWGIISCGQENQYGHPHKETLDRLENAGCRWVTTAEHGAIRLQKNKEKYDLTVFR